jgi:hypothetical protein
MRSQSFMVFHLTFIPCRACILVFSGNSRDLCGFVKGTQIPIIFIIFCKAVGEGMFCLLLWWTVSGWGWYSLFVKQFTLISPLIYGLLVRIDQRWRESNLTPYLLRKEGVWLNLFLLRKCWHQNYKIDDIYFDLVLEFEYKKKTHFDLPWNVICRS